jgi:hypothetical protein
MGRVQNARDIVQIDRRSDFDEYLKLIERNPESSSACPYNGNASKGDLGSPTAFEMAFGKAEGGLIRFIQLHCTPD